MHSTAVPTLINYYTSELRPEFILQYTTQTLLKRLKKEAICKFHMSTLNLGTYHADGKVFSVFCAHLCIFHTVYNTYSKPHALP